MELLMQEQYTKDIVRQLVDLVKYQEECFRELLTTPIAINMLLLEKLQELDERLPLQFLNRTTEYKAQESPTFKNKLSSTLKDEFPGVTNSVIKTQKTRTQAAKKVLKMPNEHIFPQPIHYQHQHQHQQPANNCFHMPSMPFIYNNCPNYNNLCYNHQKQFYQHAYF